MVYGLDKKYLNMSFLYSLLPRIIYEHVLCIYTYMSGKYPKTAVKEVLGIIKLSQPR